MTGKQSYYVDGRLFCDEIYKDGQFKSTEWYTSKGEKERAYMYRDDRLTQKIQFYPSGKLKWMEIYLPNGAIQRQVYTEDKKMAEIQELFFRKDMKRLNDILTGGKSTISWQGTMPEFLANQIIPLILECLQKDTELWVPGTINGEPATLRTVIRVPFSFVK